MKFGIFVEFAFGHNWQWKGQFNLYQPKFSKQIKRKKMGKLRKENESFWRSYTISVKPDSRKPEPEKKKMYLSTHFN